MLKRRIAVSILALFGTIRFAGAVETEVDAHVALIKNVTGSITIARAAGSLPAAAGSTLEIADRIVSGPGASAGIVFKDGTLLTVGPSSEVRIRDYVFKPSEAKYAFSVYLAKGSAIYSSGEIAPESVQVGSPTATVGVRGTRFLIIAE